MKKLFVAIILLTVPLTKAETRGGSCAHGYKYVKGSSDLSYRCEPKKGICGCKLNQVQKECLPGYNARRTTGLGQLRGYICQKPICEQPTLVN